MRHPDRYRWIWSRHRGRGSTRISPSRVRMYQVPRIAAERGLSQARVAQLVVQNETGRFLGIFGEPYVNVLDLNLWRWMR